MVKTLRIATVAALSAGMLALGTGIATADEPTTYGPEWQPGATDPNFDPAPNQDAFDPAPNQDAFAPGANPGSADLVDDNVADLLDSLLGGLFG